MQENTNAFVQYSVFNEKIPNIQLEQEKRLHLYEKAFLSPEPIAESEYTVNTTAWD